MHKMYDCANYELTSLKSYSGQTNGQTSCLSKIIGDKWCQLCGAIGMCFPELNFTYLLFFPQNLYGFCTLTFCFDVSNKFLTYLIFLENFEI